MHPSIRNRLRELRSMRGFSGRELGRMVGHGRSWTHKVESGITKNIPPETLNKLAEILGVSRSFLLLGREEHVPDELFEAARSTNLPIGKTQEIFEAWKQIKRAHCDNTRVRQVLSKKDWVWFIKATRILVAR